MVVIGDTFNALPEHNPPFWTEALSEELRRFLTGRMKCPELAADLTQETFLRFRQFAEHTPPDNARALAYRIALNLAIDYQRKTSLENRYLSDDNDDLDNIPGIHDQPERAISAQQRLQRLQTALAELPLDCRTVFLLHGIEGLKYAEIAERLGISVSMVNRHLSRAILHCRQYLEQ